MDDLHHRGAPGRLLSEARNAFEQLSPTKALDRIHYLLLEGTLRPHSAREHARQLPGRAIRACLPALSSSPPPDSAPTATLLLPDALSAYPSLAPAALSKLVDSSHLLFASRALHSAATHLGGAALAHTPLASPGKGRELAANGAHYGTLFPSGLAGGASLHEALEIIQGNRSVTRGCWLCAGVLASSSASKRSPGAQRSASASARSVALTAHSPDAVFAAAEVLRRCGKYAVSELESVGVLWYGKDSADHDDHPALSGGHELVTLDLTRISQTLLQRIMADDTTTEKHRPQEHQFFVRTGWHISPTDALTAVAVAAQDCWRACGEPSEALRIRVPKAGSIYEQHVAAASLRVRSRDVDWPSFDYNTRASLTIQAHRQAKAAGDQVKECACAAIPPETVLALASLPDDVVDRWRCRDLVSVLCMSLERCKCPAHLQAALEHGLVNVGNKLQCCVSSATSLQALHEDYVERYNELHAQTAAAKAESASAKDCRRAIEAAEQCAESAPYAARCGLLAARRRLKSIAINMRSIDEHERSAIETAARAATQSCHLAGIEEGEKVALTAAWTLQIANQYARERSGSSALLAEQELHIDLPSTAPQFTQSLEQPLERTVMSARKCKSASEQQTEDSKRAQEAEEVQEAESVDKESNDKESEDSEIEG